MKLIISLFLTAIVFYACDKEEPVKLETFSTEAFAFDLGNTWEVNAATRVRGFTQTEEGSNFFATITYDLDLVTPSGDTIKSLISRVEDKKNSERINEISLEAQFELDSTYTPGEYRIIFNINEPGTEQSSKAEVSFKLGEE